MDLVTHDAVLVTPDVACNAMQHKPTMVQNNTEEIWEEIWGGSPFWLLPCARPDQASKV